MAAKRFRLGTRAKVVNKIADSDVVLGKTGVVRDLEFSGSKDPFIGVMFSDWSGGHDLNGQGKNRGQCGGWYVDPLALKAVRKRKTVKK